MNFQMRKISRYFQSWVEFPLWQQIQSRLIWKVLESILVGKQLRSKGKLVNRCVFCNCPSFDRMILRSQKTTWTISTGVGVVMVRKRECSFLTGVDLRTGCESRERRLWHIGIGMVLMDYFRFENKRENLITKKTKTGHSQQSYSTISKSWARIFNRSVIQERTRSVPPARKNSLT